MERTDAIIILKALRTYDGRPVLASALRTNVNVARDNPLSADEFAGAMTQLRDDALADSVKDRLSTEQRWFITAAGRAALKEAGL